MVVCIIYPNPPGPGARRERPTKCKDQQVLTSKTEREHKAIEEISTSRRVIKVLGKVMLVVEMS